MNSVESANYHFEKFFLSAFAWSSLALGYFLWKALPDDLTLNVLLILFSRKAAYE